MELLLIPLSSAHHHIPHHLYRIPLLLRHILFGEMIVLGYLKFIKLLSFQTKG
jgi:hypothetical protein